MSIRSILNPGTYHGLNKKPPFFEGWYYKLVSADEKNKIAIIPGVILGQDAHAFIQVLDGVDGTTAYHKFTTEQFIADYPHFSFSIENNKFDGKRLDLNIQRPDGQLTGTILLGELNPWPVSFLSPGIMGWYAWVPRMECYHGVLSFDHSLDGNLNLNGRSIDFTGGRGYIEKDWGQAFPAAWVWFQSNHFKKGSACITSSVAIIPWIGHAFRGFIVGLWVEGLLYRFTTYNRSSIESLEIQDDHVSWVVKNAQYRLSITVWRKGGGLLLGPTHIDMGKRVLETLDGKIEVRLETLAGNVIFNDIGSHAGIEVVGDIPRLLEE